ncbi:MAG: neutral zinc metallopeptidase [Actinomycetota bacterium]|nr:neutral zinc metallopeptidase [Actinomycetota bacterium]
MKWRRGKMSRDVIDRRGAPRVGGGAGMAIGGLGIPGLLILALVFFLNGGFSGGGTAIDSPFDDMQGGDTRGEAPLEGPDPDARLAQFVSFVLDDVQNFWEDTFSGSGREYRRAKLVLFEAGTNSGCGGATEQIGPHYCPADENVYLDLSFFKDLRTDFGAQGDFAQAYVVAHEIGHHVQHVMGINEQVRREQEADQDQANELSIRLELQADCLAGAWAFTAYERELLESGDLQEGLDAAAAVGDDRIQEEATGSIDRESWTHGSSEQRVEWFTNGYEDGDPNACDTFSVDEL